MFCMFSYAQNYIYCEILGHYDHIAAGKIKEKNIEFNFSEQQGEFFNKVTTGQDGKPIKFEKMVDAMNILSQYGWELDQAYGVAVGNSQFAKYYWVLKLDLDKLTPEEKSIIMGK